MIPDGAGIWLAGMDLDGPPEGSSISAWRNRADASNPAIQPNGSLWPAVARDMYGGLSLARFLGPQYLRMTRPTTAAAWDLWVVLSGNLTNTTGVVGDESSGRWRLGTTYNLPLVERFTAVSRGTLALSYVVISTLDFTDTPVVVRTWYDGTTAGIQTFGIFEGVTTRPLTLIPQGVLAIGGVPGGLLSFPGSVYELLWYPRVLNTLEQQAMFTYLRGRYIP